MAEENDEEVSIEFDVNADKVTPKLSKMEKAVDRLGGAVDRASRRFTSMAAGAAGIAGFLALGPAIQGAKNYIDHLDKISDLTGIAADRVGGISNALQQSGVSAEGVDQVFSSLVKKGTRMGEGQKSLIRMAKGYGIALKKGPEATLMAVSGLMEKGKLSTGQMQRVLGVSSDTAADLADALSQGPGALGKMIDEAQKKNKAFNSDAMDGMMRYKNATAGIKVAWNRMTASILIRLAPAMEKLSSKFAANIDNWSVKAEKFADFMVNHMDQLIKMAKTYAKIMLVNRGLEMVTGKGIGGNLIGLNRGVGKAGSFIGGGMKNIIGRGFGGNLSAIGGILTRFFTGAIALRPILMALGRLTVVGTVILAVVGILSKMNDKSSAIGKSMTRIFETISRISDTLGRMFAGDSPLGKIIEWLGSRLLDVVNGVLESTAKILELVETIINWASVAIEAFKRGESMDTTRARRGMAQTADYQRRLGESGLSKYLAGGSQEGAIRALAKKALSGGKATAADRALFAKYAAAQEKMGGNYANSEVFKKMKAKFGANATTPEMNVYQDFRNSRFDITQAFAEGYDPDRIAVAFANDISSLGEKKLQSGFSPLFSVR